MCYPLPGPRCSSSAAARLARAKHAAQAYFLDSRGTTEMIWEEFEKLAQAKDEAQREYDITPAGIKALERRAKDSNEPEDQYSPLVNARAQRAARIAAVKALDRGDFHEEALEDGHQPEPLPIRYARTKLSQPDEDLPYLKHGDPQVSVLLDESEAWVNRLNADEIEALHWYSMGGYEEINGGLSDPNWEGRVLSDGSRKQAASEETIALLDSAMRKVDSSKEVVTYRRHFFYDEEPGATFADLTLEEQRAQFVPGEIFRPGFYMSSSLNPSNISSAGSDGGFMIPLEIKSRKGAALPAVAQQGTNEMEILMPRDAEYRVVSNDRWVNVVDKDGSHRVPVIQLEEL